jgi:acetyl/propionyl-CoA carboxylase alpha subunit
MKVIAHGANREQAISRLSQALKELRLEGIANNVAYVRSVLAHPAFLAGELHTGFLGQYHIQLLG